jgi:transcriptional regulator with XRE-family HTH domain
MTFTEQILRIEHRLRKAGVSVDEFCARVGIWRQTWTKWKSGKTEPQMRVWRRVESALAAIPAKQKRAA